MAFLGRAPALLSCSAPVVLSFVHDSMGACRPARRPVAILGRAPALLSCSVPVVLPCLHGVVENMLACVAWLFSLVYGVVGRVSVPCLSAVMRCCGLSSCSPIYGGFWPRLCSVVLLCGCLVFLVRWFMVDWGRALVLCCSVSRDCAALFSCLLRRSEVALEHVVSCCSVDSGRAALFGRRLRRSMADLGCRSVVLLLFPVMSTSPPSACGGSGHSVVLILGACGIVDGIG
ncbi:hypothetical protein GOP47_0020936 [Adiantum capillus-veneris]|uniref:Uncharacterized protein n=1 Tax=Adiantum capillus-veneris TaxID=13818 RepID=A0A9D4UA47_ADICA|nr:hypothetical protein GOP47_0020936 [Adiantum capillus-veneris]